MVSENYLTSPHHDHPFISVVVCGFNLGVINTVPIAGPA